MCIAGVLFGVRVVQVICWIHGFKYMPHHAAFRPPTHVLISFVLKEISSAWPCSLRVPALRLCPFVCCAAKMSSKILCNREPSRKCLLQLLLHPSASHAPLTDSCCGSRLSSAFEKESIGATQKRRPSPASQPEG